MNGVEESAFKFEFDGENANDWGGPFRDALVMIGYEL
jgi:hypothetical protein